MTMTEFEARIAALDWAALREALERQGWATAPVLSPAECMAFDALWTDEAAFRKTVVMARHGFGDGLYKYWHYPLPDPVAALRGALYAALAPLAESWRQRLDPEARPYPEAYAAYLDRCHAAGQRLPTPLLLRYQPGGYNCLHQDRYGEELFPLQAAILLSAPGTDFTGGEFVLVEQRPRAQSAAQVVPLVQGEMVVFAVNHRPVRGTRGWYRTALRHGVSPVRRGKRSTLGIILHDATT
jgi:hypothetical protein